MRIKTLLVYWCPGFLLAIQVAVARWEACDDLSNTKKKLALAVVDAFSGEVVRPQMQSVLPRTALASALSRGTNRRAAQTELAQKIAGHLMPS